MLYLKGFSMKWNATSLPTIWTRVTDSISYVHNHYAKSVRLHINNGVYTKPLYHWQTVNSFKNTKRNIWHNIINDTQ